MKANGMKLTVAAAAALCAVTSFGGALTAKIAQAHKVKATDVWCGGERTIFDFNGYDAWVVEPAPGVTPAQGNPWTWTMQWREFFSERTSVPKMLSLGWRHAAIDTFKHRMDAEGLKVNAAFQQYLVKELGFAPKAHLIGMSWGGFFSTRYSVNYPDSVAKVYLDAPLMCFADGFSGDIGPWAKFKPAEGKWEKEPEMPVNMAARLAKAKIPVLLLFGRDDIIVKPAANCSLFAERFKAAGGDIQVVERWNWGHHPHGVDLSDNTIVGFFLK